MSLGSLVGGAAHCSFGRLGVNAFLQLVSTSCDSTSLPGWRILRVQFPTPLPAAMLSTGNALLEGSQHSPAGALAGCPKRYPADQLHGKPGHCVALITYRITLPFRHLIHSSRRIL